MLTWLLNATLVVFTIVNVVMTLRAARARRRLMRMIGFHRSMINALRSMHAAHELRDMDGVGVFYRRYHQISKDYDEFLEVLESSCFHIDEHP